MKALFTSKITMIIFIIVLLLSSFNLILVVKESMVPQYTVNHYFTNIPSAQLKPCKLLLPESVKYNNITYTIIKFTDSQNIGSQIGCTDQDNVIWPDQEVYQVTNENANKAIALLYSSPDFYVVAYNESYWKEQLPKIIILSIIVLVSCIGSTVSLIGMIKEYKMPYKRRK